MAVQKTVEAAPPLTNEKKKALNLAIAQIEKTIGKGSIMRMGQDRALGKVDSISTGAINLDAAIGIGGAHGKGIVYENKKKVGKASLSQGTIGFQLGGQIYAEVIFFETETTLENFKQSTMKLSAQVSAVAAAEGVSENAKYEHGVAVFTIARTGLMFEASVGGQKFKYQPGK